MSVGRVEPSCIYEGWLIAVSSVAEAAESFAHVGTRNHSLLTSVYIIFVVVSMVGLIVLTLLQE